MLSIPYIVRTVPRDSDTNLSSSLKERKKPNIIKMRLTATVSLLTIWGFVNVLAIPVKTGQTPTTFCSQKYISSFATDSTTEEIENPTAKYHLPGSPVNVLRAYSSI